MTTPWTLPTTVVQYAEPGTELYDISWDDSSDFQGLKTLDDTYIKTTRDLLHISRSPKIDVTMKTWYLRITGFAFTNLPETLSGIAVRVTGNRRGRITDDTVQLCLQSEGLGENRANLDLSPQKIYGNDTDLWNTQLTIADIMDPTFGVLVRLQSHPHYPHKDSAFLDCVEVQIY
jgi:hypothetical protein